MSHHYFKAAFGLFSLAVLPAWSFQDSFLPVKAEPSSIVFPLQVVGFATFPQSIRLTNLQSTDPSTLELTDPSHSFYFTNGYFNCGSGYCVTSIAFQPTAVGLQTATLTIKGVAEQQPARVTLTGTGTATPGYSATIAYQILSRLPGTPPLGPDSADPDSTGVGLTAYDTTRHSWILAGANKFDLKILNGVTGKSLDISGASTQEGAQLIQWPYWGGSNQQWLFTSTDSGYTIIQSAKSYMVIDIPGGIPGLTDYLEQWPYWGGANQQWQLKPIGNLVPPFGGGYVLKNRYSGLFLAMPTANFGSPYAGMPVVQREPGTQADASCIWNVYAAEEGYYFLSPYGSDFGLVLDLPGYQTTPGIQLDAWYENGGANQQWKIEATGDGYYKITSRWSGLVLDDSGVSTSENNPIVQWDYWGGTNQQWQLIPVAYQ